MNLISTIPNDIIRTEDNLIVVGLVRDDNSVPRILLRTDFKVATYHDTRNKNDPENPHSGKERDFNWIDMPDKDELGVILAVTPRKHIEDLIKKISVDLFWAWNQAEDQGRAKGYKYNPDGSFTTTDWVDQNTRGHVCFIEYRNI